MYTNGTYETRLADLVKAGHGEAYIQSQLWASFSRTHNIQTIANDVEQAVQQRDADQAQGAD